MSLFWPNERENYKQTQRWLLWPQCQINSHLTYAIVNRCSVIGQNMAAKDKWMMVQSAETAILK